MDQHRPAAPAVGECPICGWPQRARAGTVATCIHCGRTAAVEAVEVPSDREMGDVLSAASLPIGALRRFLDGER